MARRVLCNAVLLDPELPEPVAGQLLVDHGRIERRLAPGDPVPDDAERVDLGGGWLAPGFIDLHFHGPMIFAEAGELASYLRQAGASCARHGTTAYLATTVAWPAPELGERVSRLAEVLSEQAGDGALAIGMHLEGPWLNPEAAGAQPRRAIRDYDPAEGEEVLARGEGLVRMVTLAPEVPGAPRLQALLARRGIVAALGHSRASGRQTDEAVANGARHVTHLFNAMGALHHREPGLAGAALVDERLSCDLICDGVHVDPRMVQLVTRVKGERLVLISDRIDPPSLEGSANGFGSGALVDDGVALRLADGRLAGSRLTLERAVHNARESGGMTRLEAVAAVSLRPARVLGVEAERGSLREGARADLVLLDDADHVRSTWIAGRRVHSDEGDDAAMTRR